MAVSALIVRPLWSFATNLASRVCLIRWAMRSIAHSQDFSSQRSDPGARYRSVVMRRSLTISSLRVAPFEHSVPRFTGLSGSPSTCTTVDPVTLRALSPRVCPSWSEGHRVSPRSRSYREEECTFGLQKSVTLPHGVPHVELVIKRGVSAQQAQRPASHGEDSCGCPGCKGGAGATARRLPRDRGAAGDPPAGGTREADRGRNDAHAGCRLRTGQWLPVRRRCPSDAR